MTEIREEITEKLLDLIACKGPVGWYVIEHSFNVPRSEFPDNTNVFSFLDELEAQGAIEKDSDGKYSRVTSD